MFLKSFRPLFFACLLCTWRLPGADRESAAEDLFRRFQDPPRQFSVRPFWFWNGKLDAGEIERQMRAMISQGVYGAYVHNRTGLLTPYLSEEYFRIVRASLDKARQLGFFLNFVDEYEWPGGEARDVWRKGVPSRVLAADPAFRMRSLEYLEREVEGPAEVALDTSKDFQFAVAARRRSSDALDQDTLVLVESPVSGRELTWRAPGGRWTLFSFRLAPAMGVDNGMVDLLNPAAVRTFINLVHEQYYRHAGAYFGSTLDSFYSDHEGDYGYRIAWTPRLFDEFRRAKGYELRRFLPLLFREGGPLTPKVRCDYLDVISELYAKSYFEQVARWAEEHKIYITGHSWEESLRAEAAYVGDHFRQMRSWSWPGIDSLWDTGRLPRDFKTAASAAHFRGRPFTVENQGLHGVESYLDMQKMRLGTNMIANWGASLLIPHAFNYHPERIEYPPDWFEHQPYWKYFRHYADYARRLSFMNAVGTHVAPLLVFHPVETGWAHTAPLFSGKGDYRGLRLKPWGNELDSLDNDYTELLNGLARNQWDYDVADSHYLLEARLEAGRLKIGPESFQALLLPPATIMRRETLRKVRAYFEQGGLIIAWRRLPADSVEAGRDDPEMASLVRSVFGAKPGPGGNRHPSGGRAFFLSGGLDELHRLLDGNLRKDVQVVSGAPGHFFYQHRRHEGVDYYWVVNDSSQARHITVRFSAAGVPEKWDAAGARRSPLFYRPAADGVEARLRFDPWEAYYVVLREGAPALCTVEEPPAIVAELGGQWQFRPGRDSVAAPYGRLRIDAGGRAETEGWFQRDYDDSGWDRVWLSRERLTVRDWWVIGPFPNSDHQGFDTAYPPETGIDLQASYPGPGSAPISWRRYSSSGYVIDFFHPLELPVSAHWVTAYAFTYVFSPAAREAEFRIAANNNAKLWVNGENLLDWHIHPYYHELREQFALARPGRLKAGWNEVLVKVERSNRGQFGFSLRIAGPDGRNFDDLAVSHVKRIQKGEGVQRGLAWHRIPVPAGAVAAILPAGADPVLAYYNGRKIGPDAQSQLRLPEAAAGAGNVLVLVMDAGKPMPDTPRFLMGSTRIPLGSWLDHGLPYYSGSAAYERDFESPSLPGGAKLILDLGEVGVLADVRVNGRPAGTRVWQPFVFDITSLVRAGKNQLRIEVTNTMENERAVENHAAKLEKLKLSGLLGPVRLLKLSRRAAPCRIPLADAGRSR